MESGTPVEQATVNNSLPSPLKFMAATGATQPFNLAMRSASMRYFDSLAMPAAGAVLVGGVGGALADGVG